MFVCLGADKAKVVMQKVLNDVEDVKRDVEEVKCSSSPVSRRL